MNARPEQVDWQVLEDAEAVAREAARWVLHGAERALAERGVFRLVLAGGRTPAQTYRLLVGAETDWSRWQLYFGDERCLAAGDPGRNSVMAADAWLGRIPIPAGNVHPMPAERGAEEAAESYEVIIRDALPFDLVLLGMGEDGHTASLFPGHLHPRGPLVLAVHGAPKPPPDRVSLSLEALNDAREVIILVTGAGKREAVKRWRAGEDLPVAGIRGRSGVAVLLDREAAPLPGPLARQGG
jgi:6-phosphogluconolactonase